MAAGVSMADMLHCDQNSGASLSLTTSNSDSYTLTDSPDGKIVRGTMTGSDFSLSIISARLKNSAVGTRNLLNGTDSGTATATTKGGSFSVESWTATYTPSDGLNKYKMTSRSVTVGSNYDSTTVGGTFTSSGTQLGGSLNNTNRDDGIVLGSLTATDQPANAPTTTYTQTVGGTYHDDATANMSVNSDGSLSGPLKMHSKSVTTTDTTTKLEGTQLLEQGMAFTANRMHSHDVYRTDLVADLTVSAGQVRGPTTTGSHDTNNWDYDMLVVVDLNDDVLHSVMTGDGSGKTKTDDTTTTTFANGTSSATRTVTFAQHGKTGAITVSWGDLSDLAGHTGEWDLTSITAGKVKDSVTITTSQNGTRSWTETGRNFSIDESSDSSSAYHEHDDGMDSPAITDPSTYGSIGHTVDMTSKAHKSDVEKGTPTNYTFTTHEDSDQERTETTSSDGGNRARDETWTGYVFKTAENTYKLDRTGSDVNGLRTLSKLSEHKLDYHWASHDHVQRSPTFESESHTQDESSYTVDREGSAGPGGSGNGVSRTYGSADRWGSQTTIDPSGQRTTHTMWNSSVYNPWPTNLSWGSKFQGAIGFIILGEDFAHDAAVHWVYVHGHQLTQIVGGVADVVSGAAMTLGTCGGAVIPGIALMAVGIDQIIAGSYKLADPSSPSMSVFQYLGYSGAQSLGMSEGAAQAVGELTPMILSTVLNAWGAMTACFAAGTPLLTPDGEKPIEQFQPGDWVLSAPEHDPDAPPEPRQVEEVFVNYLPLLQLHVGGKTIRTTSEHPFYVRERGWMAAKELRAGDLLRSHDGQWVAVEAVTPGAEPEAVYNLRVTEHHTYFVGSSAWGFSVWAHNTCAEWNQFQHATRGQFASRAEAAAVWAAWDRGTFPTKLDSILYHFTKHGAGRTLAQYTADAKAFWTANKGLASWGVWNAKWAPSWRLKIPPQGGYFTANELILTFWS